MKKIFLSIFTLFFFLNPKAQIIFFDDFEGIDHWQTNAGWERGVPGQAILDSAFSGSNVWMTGLNTNYYYNVNWILESPIIDLSNSTNAVLSFWQKSVVHIGQDGYLLEYTTDVSNPNPNWINLGNATSTDPSALLNWDNYTNTSALSTAGWSAIKTNWTKSMYLLNTLNSIGLVKFRFVFKSRLNTAEGIAIDDFKIEQVQNNQILIQDVEFGNKTPSNELVQGDSVSIALESFFLGISQVDTFDVEYTINGLNPQFFTYIYQSLPFNKISIPFGVLPHFIAPSGDTEVDLKFRIRGDTSSNVASIKKTIWSVPIYSIPFQDNFDGLNQSWTSIGEDWEVGKPVNVFLDSAYSWPNAWTTNLDDNYQGFRDQYLLSPIFDFSTLKANHLKFYHKRQLGRFSQYNIQYSVDTGNTWKRLGGINDYLSKNWYNGVQQFHPFDTGFVDTTDAYIESSYVLLPSEGFNDLTRFRLYFDARASAEGIAFDDFSIEPVVGKDLALKNIEKPLACLSLLPDTVSIQITVSNLSNDTLINIPFNYSFNGLQQLPVSYVWQDTIWPTQTVLINLPSFASNIVGPYEFKVYAELADDFDQENDTLTQMICGNMAQEIEIIALADDTCYFEGNYPLKIKLKNNGHSRIDSLSLSYQFNNNNIVSETFRNLNLMPDSTQTVVFSNLLYYQNASNKVKVYASKLPSDLVQRNDTLEWMIDAKLFSTPYFTDFEQQNDFCFLRTQKQGKVKISDNNICSGQKSLEFSGISGNQIWQSSTIANAWDQNRNARFLSSAFIAIDSKNGADLHLEYKKRVAFNNNSQTFYRILLNGNEIYRERISSASLSCTSNNLDLSPFYNLGDTITLEIQVKTNVGGPLIFDDIKVENQPKNSLEVAQIILNPIVPSPNKSNGIFVELKNNGENSISNADLTYLVNGQMLQKTFTFQAIKTGESVLVNYPRAFIAQNGLNSICVYQTIPDDYPTDDTLCLNRKAKLIQNYPFCEDFEQTDGDWLSLIIKDSLSNIWQFGSPNQTQINSAHSGSNAWMTGLNDNYQNSTTAHLITPGFEVKKDSCYQMRFWHQYATQNNIDGGTVEYSVDGGTNWRQLGKFGDLDWFSHQAIQSLWDFNTIPNLPGSGWAGNSAGWQEAINRFKLNRDGVVHFRFRFASDVSNTDEGWAIDDFCFERLNSACTGVSVQELNKEAISVQVYPNPSNGKFYFQLDLEKIKSEEFQIIITDILGKIILHRNIQSNENQPLELDLSDFPSGLYQYEIKINNQKTNGKLVKY